MTNLASVMWHNFRESCKKCAILRKHDSEHNLSLITAAAPSIAYINNWSHTTSWVCEQLLITSVLDHKSGPVIRHSVRWLGASANMYLNMNYIWLSDEWLRMAKWWMQTYFNWYASATRRLMSLSFHLAVGTFYKTQYHWSRQNSGNVLRMFH